MSQPNVPSRIPLTFLDAVQLECRGSPPPSAPANELDKLRRHISAKRLSLTTITANSDGGAQGARFLPRRPGCQSSAGRKQRRARVSLQLQCWMPSWLRRSGFRWFTCEVVKAGWSFSLFSSAFGPTRGLLPLGLWTWASVSR